jgi:nucleoside-diphosphate-sugar epimerase
MASKDLILVTGGSGFVGSRIILTALEQGYQVRTTLRSLERVPDVEKLLLRGGASQAQVESVSFTAADLLHDESWLEACRDCTYVLHVASPFPPTQPKHEDELIIPAREGTLRVLRAAVAARTVKRVVITSSIAAVNYGHADRGSTPYTEADWSDLNNAARPVAPYPKSKTLAERAAWDFIAKEGNGVELTTILPVGIFGPVLGGNESSHATTVKLVGRMLKGEMPALPNLYVGCVDVRDVASLHLLAMTSPHAAGERYLCLSPDGLQTMQTMAQGLRKRLGVKASKVPTRVVPNFLLRLVGMGDSEVANIIPELGRLKCASSEKAQRVLEWKPRSAEDAVVATAQSLEELKVVESA